jgi:hypothetical protein
MCTGTPNLHIWNDKITIYVVTLCFIPFSDNLPLSAKHGKPQLPQLPQQQQPQQQNQLQQQQHPAHAAPTHPEGTVAAPEEFQCPKYWSNFRFKRSDILASMAAAPGWK